MYEYDVLSNLKRHEFDKPYSLSLPEGEAVIEALDEFVCGMGDLLEVLEGYDKWNIKGYQLDKKEAAGVIKVLEWYKDRLEEAKRELD